MGKVPNITKKQLLPYIVKAWEQIQHILMEKKAELGRLYDEKNCYVQMYRRFCDPSMETAKFFDEYMLCLNKVSKQSSGIRGAIMCVGRMAVDMCLEKKEKKRNRRKQKKEETTKTKYL